LKKKASRHRGIEASSREEEAKRHRAEKKRQRERQENIRRFAQII